MTYPIHRDRRYTVTKEFTGHAKPQWVVRFCGEWVASSPFYSSAVVRAVGHNAERMGAPVIVAKES
jgi:hypothetical protein